MTAEIKVAYDERGIPYLLEATGKEAVNVNKALEKQIPMRVDEKTIIRNDNYNDGTDITRYDWFCPRCNLETMSTKFKYCPCCGQALDWSESR